MKEWKPTFEINLAVKDAKGNPTNRRKHFITNDPIKLSDFFLRHQGKPKKKKKSKATDSVEATKVLTADKELERMYEDQEKRIEKIEQENSEQAAEN